MPFDDTLPARIFEEPLSDGASKGMIVDLEPLLEDYYRARNWQCDTGYPSPEKMKELGSEVLRLSRRVNNMATSTPSFEFTKGDIQKMVLSL